MNTRIPPALLAVLALALIGLLFAPTLRWLALSWMGNEYYSHAVLVPLISAWLIWRRRDALTRSEMAPPAEPSDAGIDWTTDAAPTPAVETPTRRTPPKTLGLALIAVGVGAHLMAQPFQYYVVSAFGLVAVIIGLVWTMWGWPVVRAWAFPLLFLLAMVPLPGIERLSPTLEAFTATWAARGAQLLGVAATNLGSQVDLGSAAFTVGAPCSGLRSLVALFTLAVLFAYTVRGPWWAKVALVVLAAPIALLANLVRVSSIFWVAAALGANTALGFFHNFSSPLLFLVAFTLLLAVSRALRVNQLRTDAW